MRAFWVFVGLFLASPSWAAISFINSSTDHSASATSRTPAEPTSTAQNDLVLAQCQVSNASATITDPADFTQIEHHEHTNAGVNLTLYLGYKIRGADAGSGYTFSHDQAATNMRCSLATYRGVDTTTPIDTTYARASHYTNSTNTANENPSAVTTTTNNAWVLVINGINSTISGDGGPPSGYTEDYDYINGSGNHRGQYVAHKEVTTAGSEDPGVFTHTDVNGTADPYAITLALRPASSTPSFTAGPTVQSRTDAAYTISYTADSSGDTVYFMLLDTVDGATPPSCNDIESTTGSHGAANESTTGSADTIVVTATDTPEFPYYDIFGCIERATDNDSAVSTLADETLNEPTGRNFVTITSIGSGSPCEDFNALAVTDIAANDVILLNETTDPGAYVFTLSAACQGSYSGDSSRQSVLNSDVYDDSVGGWNSDDLDMWFNNQAPVCDDPVTYPFDIDVAWTTVTLNDYCTDAEGDTITYTLTTGALPTGLNLSTPDITGDPTTENESGIPNTFTATDIASDTDTQSFTWYPIDSVTMPTLTDSDLAASFADELTSFPWRQGPEQSVSNACAQEAADQIVTQNPAASTEVAFDVSITTTRSVAHLCRRRR